MACGNWSFLFWLEGICMECIACFSSNYLIKVLQKYPILILQMEKTAFLIAKLVFLVESIASLESTFFILTIFWYETKSRHSSLKKVFWNIVLLWFFPTGDVTRWSVRPRDLFSLVWSSTWTRRRRCPVASASSNSTSGVRVRYLNITN